MNEGNSISQLPIFLLINESLYSINYKYNENRFVSKVCLVVELQSSEYLHR
jgi:hypothetical protein